MTVQDVGRVMDVLTVCYPSFYSKQSDIDKYNAATIWASIFEKYPVEIVVASVKSFITQDDKGFPPVPGQIMKIVRRLTEPNEMTEAEAWSIVSRALSRSGYYAEEEFEKLPVNLQMLVGSPNRLKEWSMIEGDELQTVVASNFQRAYRARSQSEREYRALPSDVKALVNGLSDKLSLTD